MNPGPHGSLLTAALVSYLWQLPSGTIERETRWATWPLRHPWSPYSTAVAPGVTENWAVSVVALATLILLTVIPEPAFTCVAPLKFVFRPTIVAVTICPGDALAGLIHTRTGVLGSCRPWLNRRACRD